MASAPHSPSSCVGCAIAKIKSVTADSNPDRVPQVSILRPGKHQFTLLQRMILAVVLAGVVGLTAVQVTIQQLRFPTPIASNILISANFIDFLATSACILFASAIFMQSSMLSIIG